MFSGSPFGGGFGTMFGDFFGFGGNQEEEHRKGDMVVVPLMVTLEELYNGALIDMLRTKVTVKLMNMVTFIQQLYKQIKQ